MRRFLIACCFIALFAAAAGCTDRGQDGPGSRPASRASQKIVVIGVLPEKNVFRQMERYEPLAEYLSRRTGVEFRLKVLLQYGNVIKNFVSDGLDGAFFGSFTYVLAHARFGVLAVARPVNLNGKSTYYGLLFTRRDSGIHTAQEMKGKRFVFVDKATTAGYLLPLVYFRRHGIDYKTFFREYYFAGTHENAVMDVMDKKADIGAAKNTVFEQPLGADHRSTKDLVVLDRSPDVPENALALRKELDPRLVERIRATLLAMHDDPEGEEILSAFGARKFIATTDDDYRPVYQYVREAKIDLATFDYLNE